MPFEGKYFHRQPFGLTLWHFTLNRNTLVLYFSSSKKEKGLREWEANRSFSELVNYQVFAFLRSQISKCSKLRREIQTKLSTRLSKPSSPISGIKNLKLSSQTSMKKLKQVWKVTKLCTWSCWMKRVIEICHRLSLNDFAVIVRNLVVSMNFEGLEREIHHSNVVSGFLLICFHLSNYRFSLHWSIMYLSEATLSCQKLNDGKVLQMINRKVIKLKSYPMTNKYFVYLLA